VSQGRSGIPISAFNFKSVEAVTPVSQVVPQVPDGLSKRQLLPAPHPLSSPL